MNEKIIIKNFSVIKEQVTKAKRIDHTFGNLLERKKTTNGKLNELENIMETLM